MMPLTCHRKDVLVFVAALAGSLFLLVLQDVSQQIQRPQADSAHILSSTRFIQPDKNDKHASPTARLRHTLSDFRSGVRKAEVIPNRVTGGPAPMHSTINPFALGRKVPGLLPEPPVSDPMDQTTTSSYIASGPGTFFEFNENLKSVQLEFQGRQKLLQQTCKSQPAHSTTSPVVQNHIHTDDEHHALYCVVPKTGSTNWLRMLVNISGHGSNNRDVQGHVHTIGMREKYDILPLSQFSTQEQEHRLQTYKKVILVRHPFSRWLSAFRQNFQLQAYQKLGVNIIRNYRKGGDTLKEIDGSRVTFEEFLRFLVDKGKIGSTFDQHWGPYRYLCDPCYIQYDYIIKMESLESDMQYLRAALFHGDMSAVMPPKYSTYNEQGTLRNYYSKVPIGLVQELVEVFHEDFEMFGYETSIQSIFR